MEKSIDFDLVCDLYDSYVHVDFDIGFFLDFCRGHRNILELMCGTGRVSLPLLAEGFRLTCVDYSQGMLDVFRAKLPAGCAANIVCQDVTELSLQERFDLALIPFNSIAEITDKQKRQKAFCRIYEHLLPGGVFLCTLYNPEYRKQSADGNLKVLGKFPMADGKTLIVSFVNRIEAGLITGTQFYDVYGPDNKLTERRFMDIRFALITREEIVEMGEAAGFLLREMFGDYAGNPFGDGSMFMNSVFVKG